MFGKRRKNELSIISTNKEYSKVGNKYNVSIESNSTFALKCDDCGSDHFRFESKVTLGTFPFYGYTCLKCCNLMFVDGDAMIDKKIIEVDNYVSKKSILFLK
jgi:hypothetical protein